jgi:hypothetical protein
MGIDNNGFQCLLYAKKINVDFKHTALIGRQGLHLSQDDMKNAFCAFGYTISEEEINKIFIINNGYAEQLIAFLGGLEVHSFDYSDYEGATHLHDMNKEIPEEFREKYTAVLDGGTLEHIFNFPVAIKNCMEMVSVGGHFIGIVPANNFMGHGFYQFSPEVYFNIFSAENGFEITTVVAIEDRPKATWYSVINPKDVHGRVTLTNNVPVHLFVVAKKLMRNMIFETIPQQYDYLALWQQNTSFSDGSTISSMQKLSKQGSSLDFIKRRIPASVKKFIRKALGISVPVYDPRFFQPINPTAENKSL